MPNIMNAMTVIASTDLTVSGGATPAVTSAEINLNHASGPVSFILYGTVSTSVSVTYQIGYQRVAGTTIWINPSGGAAIADLTTISVAAANSTHGSFNLPSGQRFRFTITNNDGANVATGVELHMWATEVTY